MKEFSVWITAEAPVPNTNVEIDKNRDAGSF